MKKLFLLTVVFVFALLNVNAQEIKFGIKAGLNFASIRGDEADGTDGRTSFHVGGVVDIGVSEKFSVQPELLYSSQGYSVEGDSGKIDAKFDYINIPVLAKFMVADGFSIEVGPQIGFLMSAKAEGEDLKEFVKSTDFSGAIGLGYKLESGLNFAARYNLGLGNIAETGDAKNNVIQLSVGYFF